MFCVNCGKDLKDSAVCDACNKQTKQNYPSANPYTQNSYPRQPVNPYIQNNQTAYTPYNQYRPYAYQNTNTNPNPHKAKTIIALVFGIISLVWSLFSFIMAFAALTLNDSSGMRLFIIVFISFIPFGLALTGLLLTAFIKTPKGQERILIITDIVLNSIALGIIFISCLIAMFG